MTSVNGVLGLVQRRILGAWMFHDTPRGDGSFDSRRLVLLQGFLQDLLAGDKLEWLEGGGQGLQA